MSSYEASGTFAERTTARAYNFRLALRPVLLHSKITAVESRKIGDSEKSGLKVQRLTEEGKRLLFRVTGRFEKMRVGENGIALWSMLSKSFILVSTKSYHDTFENRLILYSSIVV